MQENVEKSVADRHAYMIMAHGNLAGLEKLLSVLDDAHNDIYVHIDLKCKDFNSDKFIQHIQNARIWFVDRVKVNWAGYSQIKAELILLKEATKEYHQYYHLMSGVDFPLKTQLEIRQFFSANNGKEYIRFDENANQSGDFLDRVRYFYFFQDKIGRNRGKSCRRLLQIQRFLLALQKRLKIDRTRRSKYRMYKGTNWFSITHQMAIFVLQNEKYIKKYFRFGLGADEVFLHTLAMASPYKEQIVNNCLRYIDWVRGDPYIFTDNDYDELIVNKNLFARKFNYEKDPMVIDKLFVYLTKTNTEKSHEVKSNYEFEEHIAENCPWGGDIS